MHLKDREVNIYTGFKCIKISMLEKMSGFH